MPDFPPLPPRAELPYVPFDDRAFDRAAALARRRVHRAAAVTSVAAAVAAVAMAVPSGRPASIGVTPAATKPAEPAATASRAADDGPARSTGTTPAPAASPSPTATPPPSQTPEGHEPPPPGYEEPTVSESERPDGYVVHTVEKKRQVSYTYPDGPARYEYVADAAPAGCHTEEAWASSSVQDPTYAYDTQRAREFCLSFTAPSTVVAGTTAQFVLSICRSGDATVTAHTLTATKDRPLFSMPVAWAADVHRSWGQWAGVTPPDTTITVQPGDCVRWTYEWKAVAEGLRHGPLEAGTYEANVRINTEEFRPECMPEPEHRGDGCYAKTIEVTNS